MREDYVPSMERIAAARESMCERVVEWADINTGSHNVHGLDRLSSLLKGSFSELGAEIEELNLPAETIVRSDGELVPVPLGKALAIRKRRDAPLQIFLGIHSDTVFGVDHPFQKTERIDENTLRGPGVADAKGGLVILLKSLETLEASPFAAGIGWEVLINPDEEIGSPGSGLLFREIARRNHLGLIFEPALPGGALVTSRKGSGNFALVVRGRAAHAGRDPTVGRNAIAALAEFIMTINVLNDLNPAISVNMGKIEGGGPVNIVPDLAICRFNIRVASGDDQLVAEQYLSRTVARMNLLDGISADLHGRFHSPPLSTSDERQWLCRSLTECGSDLGVKLEWKGSGGTCDGNRLAAEGLPVVDSLGACGGQIHSVDEYLEIDSLVARSQLTSLFLLKLASGEIRPR